MDEFDYKDINDLDLSKLDNMYDDYYEGLGDEEIIKKEFTEEELVDFKSKVKKYCERLLEDIPFKEELSVEELYEKLYTEIEEADNEFFSEKILEEFYGQRDMFFEYAKETAQEIANEYNEKRLARAKDEFKSKLEGIFQNNFRLSNVVEDTLELLKYNEIYKTIDDPDIIRKFIFYKEDEAYIPSEILGYIDSELIQKDDALMEDLLGCWIAPNDKIYDLSDYMAEEKAGYGVGRELYEIYENFGHYGTKYDFSEYYEKFYNKVISENMNGVGTEEYDYNDYHDYEENDRWGDFESGEEAYWKSFERMPSRILNKKGGLDNLTDEDIEYYFPRKFIIEKYLEANRIDDIKYFLINGEYAWSRIGTIYEVFNKHSHELDQINKNKLRNIAIENIEDCGINYREDLRFMEREAREFTIESYIKAEKEIPEDVKETLSIKDVEIERIKKEIELERLQEEDKKCDDALALAEELDKNNSNKEQEGQTQNDE